MKALKGSPMQTHKLIALPLASAALIAACGGGSDDPGAPPPVVTSSSASSGVRYSETLLITLRGNNLDQALTLSSTACKAFTRNTAAPFVSTATTAYYTCTVSGATGNVSVTVAGGGVTAATVPFTVDVPQVTLNVSNGTGTTSTLVVTLHPNQAPVTVDNFLAYVQAGFYTGTAFHRHARNSDLSSYALQGGGYDAPLSSTRLFPPHKPTRANIALEAGRGLSNLRYTVAMARLSEPNSANSEFFINTADNVRFDTQGGGYAVFGTIVTGTTVVDAMVTAPCNFSANFSLGSPDCVPEPNLIISSATQTR